MLTVLDWLLVITMVLAAVWLLYRDNHGPH